jgi:ABC-type transport system involved in multi-copper enzyme maturation permease subunit
MLKDSLAESLDSMVFYVMAGLSLLLVAVASTMTFTPQKGGDTIMKAAALPLSVDMKNLDFAGIMRRGGNMFELLGRVRGAYTVDQVAPLAGQDDAPGSSFRVVITQGGGIFAPNAETTLKDIRERFGVLDDVQIAEVENAESLGGGKFAVTARLTTSGRLMWPHDFSLFFGALPLSMQNVPVPLGFQLYGLHNILVNQIGAWVALIISIIMTAFFVPNMLRKGTVDLLLVKPISRPTLLVYKYIGGLIFIGLNTAIAVGGLWLVLALRTGVWSPAPLIAIPAITFFFAILYSVSVLFGVMTRSAVVSILVTILTWFFLFAVGLTVGVLAALDVQDAMMKGMEKAGRGKWKGPPPELKELPAEALSGEPLPRPYSDSPFGRVVRGIQRALPRTSDLNALVSDTLQRDLVAMPRGVRDAALRADPISWGESIGVSLAFIAVMLGLACWWFSTKDY